MPIVLQFNQLGKILVQMVTPRAGKTYKDYFLFFLNGELWRDVLNTLIICFVGTLFGGLIGLPIALLTSRNIIKNKFTVYFIRVVLTILRSIPIAIIAIIFVFIVGIGTLPGILTVILFTLGILSKMLYEYVETLEMGAFEAVQSVGANKLLCTTKATLPQIMPAYIGYLIYCFEMNFRASVIFGWVGAGGIGTFLNNAIEERFYDKAGVIIIIFMAITISLQLLTKYVKGKLS
jgi:phosphonate transport system permease protein